MLNVADAYNASIESIVAVIEEVNIHPKQLIW